MAHVVRPSYPSTFTVYTHLLVHIYSAYFFLLGVCGTRGSTASYPWPAASSSARRAAGKIENKKS